MWIRCQYMCLYWWIYVCMINILGSNCNLSGGKTVMLLTVRHVCKETARQQKKKILKNCSFVQLFRVAKPLQTVLIYSNETKSNLLIFGRKL
mmetsp:Transcript_31756/g.46533  ORF Transcript_31756/g.46533 Transcript_31756/m.46533 type:complete len:92 (+) Transcript_31756:419-694(+)